MYTSARGIRVPCFGHRSATKSEKQDHQDVSDTDEGNHGVDESAGLDLPGEDAEVEQGYAQLDSSLR